MEDAFPVDESIFVLKNGRKLGPFEVDELLDGLEEGEFTYDDICLREGATECERLRDVLDWEGHEEPDEASVPLFPGSRKTPRLRNSQEESRAPVIGSDVLLYSGHPSVMSSPLALFSFVGGVTLGCWMLPLDFTFVFLGLGGALCGLTYLSFVRFTRDYHITPKRIEMITGLIARSSKEIRIEDIRSINVSCRGLSGIIGIGTVDFFTSGDSPEVTFHKIWDAKNVKALVRRLQDAA